MATLIEWITVLGIILIICPILGKIFYDMKNIHALIFYIGISVMVTLLLFFLTDQLSSTELQQVFSEYRTQFLASPGLYIVSIISYLMAGIGILGGSLEFAGENIETEATYRKIQILSPFKLYFLYLIYGYIFLFAVFAFSQFLTELLRWEYPVQTEFVENVVDLIQFRSIWLPIFGSFFFAMKTYKYGLFSVEFLRSELHPSVAEVPWGIREFRRVIACLIGPVIMYFSAFMYFIEKEPPLGDEYLPIGKALFFLAASLQAILFYIFKNRFIDQLKPLDKQYSLKVGSTALDLPSPDSKELRDAEEDLKYDD